MATGFDSLLAAKVWAERATAEACNCNFIVVHFTLLFTKVLDSEEEQELQEAHIIGTFIAFLLHAPWPSISHRYSRLWLTSPNPVPQVHAHVFVAFVPILCAFPFSCPLRGSSNQPTDESVCDPSPKPFRTSKIWLAYVLYPRQAENHSVVCQLNLLHPRAAEQFLPNQDFRGWLRYEYMPHTFPHYRFFSVDFNSCGGNCYKLHRGCMGQTCLLFFCYWCQRRVSGWRSSAGSVSTKRRKRGWRLFEHLLSLARVFLSESGYTCLLSRRRWMMMTRVYHLPPKWKNEGVVWFGMLQDSSDDDRMWLISKDFFKFWDAQWLFGFRLEHLWWLRTLSSMFIDNPRQRFLSLCVNFMDSCKPSRWIITLHCNMKHYRSRVLAVHDVRFGGQLCMTASMPLDTHGWTWLQFALKSALQTKTKIRSPC